MVYTPHQVVKPEKLAGVAAALLAEQMILPLCFKREGLEVFKGAEGDAYSITVPGILPYRSYGWRNDRSTEIQFDEYRERKIVVTFGDDIYSAVRVTDEQNEFDLDGWAKLLAAQTRAVGTGLEHKAVRHLVGADYEVVIGAAGKDLRAVLVAAKTTMDRLQVPEGVRTLVVGTDWENELLLHEKLSLASNVGDEIAASMLQTATLGSRYGFKIVVSQQVDPSAAYAMVDSAFVFVSGAPAVPQSSPFGASASAKGVALRWLRDYDMTRTTDRSLVNTYQGFRTVTDVIEGIGQDGQLVQSEGEHFVRAIKLDLGTATNKVPTANSDLGKITGVHKVKFPTVKETPAPEGASE